MMRAKISTNKGIVEEAFAPFHVNIFATELSDLSEKIVMDKVCNLVITHQWEWNKTIWYKWCHQFTIGWRLMNHSFNCYHVYSFWKCTCKKHPQPTSSLSINFNVIIFYNKKNIHCVLRILSQIFAPLFRLRLHLELCHMWSEKSKSADSYN